jgi:hypothetical protein
MWMQSLELRRGHDLLTEEDFLLENLVPSGGSSMFVLDEEWALTARHALFSYRSEGVSKGVPCVFTQNKLSNTRAYMHGTDAKLHMHQCSSTEASEADEFMLRPSDITFHDVRWREQHGGYWDNFTLSLHNVKNGYLLLRLHPRAGLPFAFARRFAPSTLRPRVHDTVLAIGYTNGSPEFPVLAGHRGRTTGHVWSRIFRSFRKTDLSITAGRVAHENEFAFLHEASTTRRHEGGPVLLLDELLRGLDSDGQWPLDRPFPFVGITQGGTDFGYSVASSVHHPGFKAHFKQFERAQRRKAAEKKEQKEAQQTAEKQEL